MTAAKLDPSLCRELAGWATTLSRTPVTTEEQAIVSNRIGTIAAQLTAAAEMAERAELFRAKIRKTEADELEALAELDEAIAERDAMRAQLAERTAAVQTVGTVGIGPADTAIICAALDYWSYSVVAPHDDIARIRSLLASPGGGS